MRVFIVVCAGVVVCDVFMEIHVCTVYDGGVCKFLCWCVQDLVGGL